MKQSERMRWYLAYQNHPLKNEYLKEKKKIKRRRLPKENKFIFALCTIPFIMIFVIGYLFFGDVRLFGSIGQFGHWLIYIAVGIGNLLLCLLILYCALEYGIGWEKTDEFEKLQEKYREKGLLEVDSPFYAKCSEYDDRLDCKVCSATHEPLSYREYIWCEKPGNCKKCAKFINYMKLDLDYWSKYNEIEKW